MEQNLSHANFVNVKEQSEYDVQSAVLAEGRLQLCAAGLLHCSTSTSANNDAGVTDVSWVLISTYVLHSCMLTIDFNRKRQTRLHYAACGSK